MNLRSTIFTAAIATLPRTLLLVLLPIAFFVGCGSNGDVDALRDRVATLEKELTDANSDPETVVDIEQLRGFLESQLSDTDGWIASSRATETLTKQLSTSPDEWPSFAIGEYNPIVQGSSTNLAEGQHLEITADGTLIYRRCEVVEPGKSDGVYKTWGKLSYDEYVVNVRTLKKLSDPGDADDTELRLSADSYSDVVKHVRAYIGVGGGDRDGEFIVHENTCGSFTILIPDSTSASLVAQAFEDLIGYYSQPEWRVPAAPTNDNAK